MVATAARANRVLVEDSPTGKGLARVDDLDAGSCDGFDVAPRLGGNARESLHEVQSRSLCG